jgi:hypothetical protein
LQNATYRVPVNPSKCAVMAFDKNGNPININLKLGNTHLPNVTKMKYLGVTWTIPMNFKVHIDLQAKKANKAMNIIRRTSGYHKGMRREALMTMYKAYIRPILEFGCPLYAFYAESHLMPLKKVEHSALRLILGTPGTTMIQAMYQESGLEQLIMRLKYISANTYIGIAMDNNSTKIESRLNMKQSHSMREYRSSFKGSQIPRVMRFLETILVNYLSI